MMESAVESGFRSTSIFPSDILDATPSRIQPEKRLLLAVLEGAVADFQKYATASSVRGRRLFADAEGWFHSSATEQPLDFENICQALALDPSFIRVGLNRWCLARRREPHSSRIMPHFPVRRVAATRHRISEPA
jgi:hypothetical protein